MEEGGGDDEALVRAAASLPLPERLSHAHWRVRSDACAEVVKEASWASEATTPPLREFGAPRRLCGARAFPARRRPRRRV